MNTPEKILVWDWPVRLGHWLLVAAFVVAWMTGDSEVWRLWHVWAGGLMVGVVLFRLVWGVVGSRYARFGEFVHGVRAAGRHLRGLLTGSVPHSVGHNPAGALAIVALLTLVLLTGASGWALYQDLGGEWLEEVHEILANTLLGVVVVHVLGVVVGSLAEHENLARAMVTGRKLGPRAAAIASAHPAAAALLLVWAGLCAYWLAR